MSNWNKIGKPIVVLCLICVVITGALAATNSATAPVIKAAEEAAAQAARTELLPEATGFTLVEGEFEGVTEIYTADNGVGTIITSSDKGYSSTVVVMVAFDPDGTIKQVKIQSQGETAGVHQDRERVLLEPVHRPARRDHHPGPAGGPDHRRQHLQQCCE